MEYKSLHDEQNIHDRKNLLTPKFYTLATFPFPKLIYSGIFPRQGLNRAPLLQQQRSTIQPLPWEDDIQETFHQYFYYFP